MRHRANRRFVAILVLVAALWTVTSATSASTDPARCAGGGWEHVQPDDGEPFKSERGCVHYVEKGGTLYAPGLFAVLFCFSDGIEMEVVGVDFHPGSLVTLTLDGALWRATHSDQTTVRATENDGPPLFILGGFIIQPGVLIDPGATFTLTARDSFGVTASYTTVNHCPRD